MRIILSPAKKMNQDTDSLPVQGLPALLEQTETLLATLRAMDPPALQALWKCSDQIAQLNLRRLEEMDLRRRLTPAILAYEGIQYQHMAPNVFTGEQFAYIQEHLRILSGFYGVLRPFDGVTPYRLEMQARLKCCGAKDLYSYWNSLIAENIFQETDCVLNLASREYSRCVSDHLRPGVRFITCQFGEEQGGRVVEKGTLCKMARGEMVRFLAEEAADAPEAAKAFDRLGHRFSPELSTEETYVFLREGARQ